MRLFQLTENKDYALAKRLLPTLSNDAEYALRDWEWSGWRDGTLATSFLKGNDLAKELHAAGEPIRQQIRKREGDTITLYRGINEYESDETREKTNKRALFSWTSSLDIAKHFAGKRHDDTKVDLITDNEIEAALKQYEKTGFVSFRGKKYKKNKDNPEYYDIFTKNNNHITDGDDLEREFKDLQSGYIKLQQNIDNVPGRVVTKEIPVDDIIWVMMGGGANEYIVKGHPE